MRLQNPFAALSPSGLDSQVLLVLARSEQHLSVQQIHQLLPETGSRAGVQKSVARFVEQGTVVERRTGRSRSFALNDQHLLAGPIRQIAASKRVLLGPIADAIAAWPALPLTVVMFGSAARGEMRADSDIDLLFVTPEEGDAVLVDELVSGLAEEAAGLTGNDVRPLIYRAAEVEPAEVFARIVDEGVHVTGDPVWLRRRLGDRIAAA